jgi:hypothetical protein
MKTDTSEYAIALQRAIEYAVKGKKIPESIACKCPHHAAMLNNHYQPTPMSDTPRTDEELIHHDVECANGRVRQIEHVDADFARQLERENNQLRVNMAESGLKILKIHKELGCELMDPNGTIWEHAAKVTAERDQLRKELEEAKSRCHCHDWRQECDNLRMENEQLRQQLESWPEFAQLRKELEAAHNSQRQLGCGYCGKELWRYKGKMPPPQADMNEALEVFKAHDAECNPVVRQWRKMADELAKYVTIPYHNRESTMRVLAAYHQLKGDNTP